ncbi:hypothetical protein BpHYR1_044016 [Brachionus plicatilis]|uniref:Uncharacterized protein n=1 Tax=Brachionus plicatilis TaxID=10195 RepID=A0A3M7Q0D9_BRAPC|nr:hypothetical protein BpHYR1_044016 [Brachionus plicatilis]
MVKKDYWNSFYEFISWNNEHFSGDFIKVFYEKLRYDAYLLQFTRIDIRKIQNSQLSSLMKKTHQSIIGALRSRLIFSNNLISIHIMKRIIEIKYKFVVLSINYRIKFKTKAYFVSTQIILSAND